MVKRRLRIFRISYWITGMLGSWVDPNHNESFLPTFATYACDPRQDVGQTTVAKYMARGRRPPSQGWKTFLRNHADGIASMDLFMVPTISFRLLYGLVLQHCRREILWLGVTAHPTAEWLARQVTEACGWENTPRYILRDRDGIYGAVFLRRLRAMGIRDRPTAARSPWQNA